MTRKRNIDDLLGDSPKPEEPPRRRRGRPRKEDTPPPPEDTESDWAKIRAGVTIGWLAGALRMDRNTVKKRLATLSPKAKRPAGGDLYDLELALPYLVKPKIDMRDYIRNMNVQELPPVLRKEYWAAEKSRLDWMERAGELWPTADVQSVLGEAFMLIKTTTQVWADDVEREAGLTKEQYKALIERVDQLREDLFAALCEMPKTHVHVLAERIEEVDGGAD